MELFKIIARVNEFYKMAQNLEDKRYNLLNLRVGKNDSMTESKQACDAAKSAYMELTKTLNNIGPNLDMLINKPQGYSLSNNTNMTPAARFVENVFKKYVSELYSGMIFKDLNELKMISTKLPSVQKNLIEYQTKLYNLVPQQYKNKAVTYEQKDKEEKQYSELKKIEGYDSWNFYLNSVIINFVQSVKNAAKDCESNFLLNA